MIRVLLVFLLLASPVEAATRFYFPSTGAAAVTRTPDAGWEETSEVQNIVLVPVTKSSTAMADGQTVDITEDTGNQDLDRQYVSPPMKGGDLINTSATFKAQVLARELTATDDVTQCILGVKVVSYDGQTVMQTTVNVANYGTTTELQTTFRNKTCANGDTITAAALYVTRPGDRLIVEIGWQTDGAETTPQAMARWGDTSSDCPEDETTTTDCSGWFEISSNISFFTESEWPPRVRPRPVILD